MFVVEPPKSIIMDAKYPLPYVFFTCLVFVFMVVKRYKSKVSTHPKVPPGPRKLPFIGNIHQLFGSLPHHSLRDLANKHGPLMHIQLGEVSTIVVSSPEIAKEVNRTHDIKFSQRPPILASKILAYDSTSIAFAPYGDYWRQLRKFSIIELLSAKRVKSFQSIREEEVSNLIRTISSNAGFPMNLSEKIFSMTYGITSRAAFSKKCNDQDAFISAIKEAISLTTGFSIAGIFPSFKVLHLISGVRSKLEKVHQRTDRILQNIIDDHKQRKAMKETRKQEAEEDLVDILLHLQEHGDIGFPLTDNNIKAVILNMFGGGSETSSTAVEWAMSEMMKNPRVMDKAQAEVRQIFGAKGHVDEMSIHELKFLKSVVKETLRLHPSAPLLLPRECREGCKINGYEIPVKTKVIINGWAIGRDPDYWTEAERFLPERFLDSPIDYKGTNFEYIPFGAGRRICPGILFAIPNIELPLATVLYHFDWELPYGMKQEDLNMTERFGLVVRRKQDLHLIPIPYNPLPVQ